MIYKPRLGTLVPHDQKRVTTPAAAVAAGSDYLVIGRAITEAANPIEIVNRIVESILKV